MRRTLGCLALIGGFLSPLHAKSPLTLLALGDSYTIGQSVDEQDRFPAQLVKKLRGAKISVNDPVYIARTGWTTDELQSAIDREKPTGPYDIVTLLIGVNNQYRHYDAETYRGEFKALLKQAISLAGNAPAHVVVISIPDWGSTPFAKTSDRKKIGAEIDRFNAINKAETETLRAHYVDITPLSKQALTEPALVAADGLHPSARMYEQWVNLIFPVVQSELNPKPSKQ